MTTAPSVELHFNPTDLRPGDLPSIGSFLGSPSDAIEAGLAMVRARMIAQMKAEVRGITEPTYGQLLRLADMAWQIFMPQYRKVSAPVMADAYVRAYREANAGDVPMSVIYDLAEKHAMKTGDYFHTTSRDALADGFNTMVNRRIPAKAAADRVLDAYGLSPRQMRGYANNKQLVTAIDSPASFDVKAHTRDYIDRSFTQRVRKLSEQEEHNIEEQAKQFAWMWLQDKGRLPKRAQKMWITAHDERVCPVCGPLHGQKVLVTEQFKTPEGDFWSPGVHPNCRCVCRLIENRFTLEKRFDPHQPRGGDGRWSGGQSNARQLGHKVNALESPSARVLQGEVIHRSAQAVGYLTEPRFLTTPIKHRDRDMARLARGASAWSRKGANVQRARKLAEDDNEYYAGKMRMGRTEKSLKSLISAVQSAPATSPELYRGMVVSPEHLKELKAGNSFTLPMSSFTESQPFSEGFARKWGPMIARAHAKREGKELPADMHPVVMVLEPKANALNISPIVSERQAEWIAQGEFLITKVGDDSGLTVVHLKQTDHRATVSKADRWDPKLHPRGGDPENPGRFARVLERERPKPLIDVPVIETTPEPEIQLAPPEINITGGGINIAPRPYARTRAEINIAPQAEISIAPAVVEEPTEINIAPVQREINIAPAQETISLFPGQGEINIVSTHPGITLQPTVQRQGVPDLAAVSPVVALSKDETPYYTVIQERDYDNDMWLDLKRFTNSTSEASSIAAEMRENHIDELLDTITGAHRDKPVLVTGNDPDTDETIYGEVSPQQFERALRKVAEQSRRGIDFDYMDAADDYEDVTWYDSLGHHADEANENNPYVSAADIVSQSGVHPWEFQYRILEITHGIRDENRTRMIGPNKFDISGQYVESGPERAIADSDGKEIPVTPMKPHV